MEQVGLEGLVPLLERLKRENASVKGVVLADKSGLPVADSFREEMDLMALSAMSTLILRSARTVFSNLGLRGGGTVILEGEDSIILVKQLDSELSLTLVADEDANVGLLNLEIEKLSKNIIAMLMEL